MGNKTNLDGTVEYEGFAIDLLNAIAEQLHFNYTITIVKDGQYGGEDPKTGKWNGMVGELIDQVSNYQAGQPMISTQNPLYNLISFFSASDRFLPFLLM